MARAPRKPSVPAEQVLAVVGGTVGLAASLGAPIGPEDAQAIQTYVTVQMPIIVAAGAWIRTTRARHWDKIGGGDEPPPRTWAEALRRPDLIVFAGVAAVALALAAAALALAI